MKKSKSVNRRVRITNTAVDQKNLADLFSFPIYSKKVPTKKFQFLNVALSLYPSAFVISWCVKDVGFGEVT